MPCVPRNKLHHHPDWSCLSAIRDGVEFVPRGKRGKWVCLLEAPPVLEEPPPSKNARYESGWNGSYHDAMAFPYVLGWGNNPARARKAARSYLKMVRAEYSVDSATARFAARQQVRPGD